jgi:hypothetical protein
MSNQEKGLSAMLVQAIFAVLLTLVIGVMTFMTVGTALYVVTGMPHLAGIVALVAMGAATVITFSWTLSW